jgi:hypothetical protein
LAGAFLVALGQTAVAYDIGDQHGGESAFHGAPFPLRNSLKIVAVVWQPVIWV